MLCGPHSSCTASQSPSSFPPSFKGLVHRCLSMHVWQVSLLSFQTCASMGTSSVLGLAKSGVRSVAPDPCPTTRLPILSGDTAVPKTAEPEAWWLPASPFLTGETC